MQLCVTSGPTTRAFVTGITQTLFPQVGTGVAFQDAARAKACTNYPKVPTVSVNALISITQQALGLLARLDVPVAALVMRNDKIVHTARVVRLLQAAVGDKLQLSQMDVGGHELGLDVGNDACVAEIKVHLERMMAT